MNHAWRPDIHGPLQRSIYLGRNVVPLGSLTGHLEVLHRLDLCDAGDSVDIVPGQRNIESFSTDEFSVSDALGGITPHGNYASTDRQPIDRRIELYGCHFEQDAASLGRGAPHGPGI